MNEVLKIVFSLSISGSILILILMLCKPIYRLHMSKFWQYYIWLFVIARLLLPFAPEHNLVGNLFRNYEGTVFQSESASISKSAFAFQTETDTFPSDTAEDTNAETSSFSPLRILNNCYFILIQNLGLIWLIVALVLLIRKITIYQSFKKYIKASHTPVDDINLLEQFGKAVEEAKINVSVELYVNSLISSPLLIGFFHPCIVLPGTDCSELDFQYTIRHELIHFKRKDMFYKWLMQITVCLHWFNPLVHLMSHYVNHLCELSCDEAVIRHLDEKAMFDYGNTLLGAIQTKGNYESSLASVTLNESKELLKERLDAIMNFKKQSNMIKALSFIMTLAFCLGGVFTGAYAAVPDSFQTFAADSEMSGDRVFYLASNGKNSITKSGSFEAEDNQILTITVQSNIKGGPVNLTLFSPDYKEQCITFSDSNETKTIELSAGWWAYNCTGFFNSGDMTITGTVPQSHDKSDRTDTAAPAATIEISDRGVTVLDLENGQRSSITQSGSFEATDNQVLTLYVQSDIKGGSVDLFLFSPDHKEQHFTFSDSDEIKVLALSAGRWDYNCTGFFDSGNIRILGKVEETD